MAKKSRTPGKVESKDPGEEEAKTSVPELNTPLHGGGIDFYYLFNGIGILIALIFIVAGLLRFAFHVM